MFYLINMYIIQSLIRIFTSSLFNARDYRKPWQSFVLSQLLKCVTRPFAKVIIFNCSITVYIVDAVYHSISVTDKQSDRHTDMQAQQIAPCGKNVDFCFRNDKRW